MGLVHRSHSRVSVPQSMLQLAEGLQSKRQSPLGHSAVHVSVKQ